MRGSLVVVGVVCSGVFAHAEPPAPQRPKEIVFSRMHSPGERFDHQAYELQVGAAFGDWWLLAIASFGTVEVETPEFERGSFSAEGRLGVRRTVCRRGLCIGVVGSAGYARQHQNYEHELFPSGREIRTVEREGLVLDARALVRVQPFAWRLILEATLGYRAFVKPHIDNISEDDPPTVVGAVGLGFAF
jgi:hypothetical protein